ncbi:CRISPR-associated protein Cas4 (plasmid) [Halococcus morrhuae DSM 1307]|nr:PD-(D/E)XK nuclease family protein [Halococcus morrhuae]
MDSDVDTVSSDAAVGDQIATHAETLINTINATSFDDWYREREFARNIREGQPYFNGPGRIPPPERHSPSQLNQCHRKIYYRQLNAPEEQADPQGIFWTGTKFEEELVVPYLESLVGPDEYVRNSMWIDITCETDAGEIRIKGATDPVIVDDESEPLLLTESKTKGSVEHLAEPDTHHRAQAHAYMYGLTQQYDHRVTDAMLIYGSRNSLDLRAFHIPFDPWFWRETVLSWTGEHTQYRLDETLPPDTPAFDWECNFCDFKHRCGQADEIHAVDTNPEGFLPLFDAYPRAKIVDYLDANPGAKLTPTLAQRYPSLVESYGVYKWHCEVCGTDYSVKNIEWDGDIDDPPQCDSCADQQVFASLAGPIPEAQTIGGGED